MALNRIYAGTDRQNRAVTVPSGTKSGDFLLVGTRPAVALTDRGDSVRSFPGPDGTTLSGVRRGGVGLEADQATVAFDGTYALPVTGVTTITATNVAVYITSGGVLNLTASGNTLFGYTDYPPNGYNKIAGEAPVRIGD